VTRHHSCRVSPFGHPRIHARLTAPRGISQPPTSFIGSQCQGIHHAPLHTYNTKTNFKRKIAHQHTQKTTTPKGGDHHACQMLATTIHKSNTTPHHQSEATTSPIPGFPQRDEEIAGLLSQSPIVCLAIPSPHNPTEAESRCGSTFVVHQTPTHYRSKAIDRFAQGRGDPRYAGRPGSRGAP
jgi:hypothetical protein